ncbi:MAG: hypothetical protein IPL61_06985 [Myxococcales bacterium]|nr:hypothetical protein [Myxococcales bacterium]
MSAHVAFLDRHYAAGTFPHLGGKISATAASSWPSAPAGRKDRAIMAEDPFVASGGAGPHHRVPRQPARQDLPARLAP